MFRGTTPTITVNLDAAASTLDVLFLTVGQNGEIVFEKTIDDASLVDNSAIFYLSQLDTLSLRPREEVSIQATGRAGAHRITTLIYKFTAEDVLKDGVI